MVKKYARAHSRSVRRKSSRTHTHTEREREKVGARKGESRGVAPSLVFEGGGLIFFFLSSLFRFPQKTNVPFFLRNANFLENEKKKNSVNDKDVVTQKKKSFFYDTRARRRRSSWNQQRSRVLREEPGRGGSRAFARVRIYR